MPTVELRAGNSLESLFPIAAVRFLEAHVSSTDAPATPADSSERESAEVQELLFDGDFSPLPLDLGFRGPVACSAAGITYRQLD